MDRPSRLRAQAGSIRARMTALAVGLVGVALVIGAVALVMVMRGALTESVLADARLRASEVVAELNAGTAPRELVLPNSDDLLIQVLGADGGVLAAGADAPDRILIPGLAPGETTIVDVPGDDDPFGVVAAAANGPGGARTVLVGRALDLIEESTEVVTVLLAVSVPILLLLVGVIAWLLVGRSLAPVEAIRGEVEEISGTQLHRRVPAPPGTDEIARLAITMNEMLARLERSHLRQRQLVADTSHELRSPLASIRQHAEVALAYPERMGTSELAETVLAESLRLARMIDDLLLLARVDERTLELKHHPLDLDDLALEAARALRRDAKLAVDATAVSGGRVRGDPDGLRLSSRTLRRMRLDTRSLASRFRSPRRATRCGSALMTTGRASLPLIGIACSSASCASTPRAPATPAAAGSGSPSWRSLSRRTAGRSSSATVHWAAPGSRSGWRMPLTPEDPFRVQRSVRCASLPLS